MLGYMLQAKYDAREDQKKQTLLPLSQQTWQEKSGYNMSRQNGYSNNFKSHNSFYLNNSNNNKVSRPNGNLLYV